MCESLDDKTKNILKGWMKEHTFPESSGYRKEAYGIVRRGSRSDHLVHII